MTNKTNLGHWSDCVLHRTPAYEPGPCDCGGLDLAAYSRYVAVTALVPTPGSLARFVKDGILPCAVETEQPPSLALPAPATTPDLIGSHDGVAILAQSDGMDFNNAREAPVGRPPTRTL